jgi:uncharacterized protein YndB with AHSA1/START domain
MSAGERVTVRVTHRYDASAERVFDAFLDPAKARRFLFTAPGGAIVRADIDARVGGAFCFVDRRGSEDIEHNGVYLEIDRPRRLVFEFAVPRYDPTMTRVTIEIAPRGKGCELELTHEVLRGWESDVTKGWTMILDNLAPVVA